MSRRILISACYQSALPAAAEFLEPRLRDSEALVLASTRPAADEFLRTCSAVGHCGAHAMTLAQLAAQVAMQPMAERKLAPLSRLGSEALAARVIHLRRRQAGLGYFEPVADTPGFSRALAATMAELRLEQVEPAALRASGPAGADLAALLELYESELRDRALADLSAIMRLAIGAARNRQHRLLGIPMVLLHVPLESRSHRAFAAELLRRAPAAVAAVLAQDVPGIAALEQVLGVKPELLEGLTSNSLDRMRARLFSTEALPPQPCDASVEFFSAPGEGLESVEIARRIRMWAEQGVPFDRMAILLRNPDRYQPLIEEALRRARIPGYFSRGSARPDPAGRAFLALLACAAEGCSASRFAEYLSLAQVPELDSRGAPLELEVPWIPPEDELLLSTRDAEPGEQPEDDASLPAPFAWEKLLVDAAVIGGHDRWARRLRGLEAEFKARLREAEDAQKEYLQRQLVHLRHLERFALPLIDRLASLPKSAVWSEWLERLGDLAQTALRSPDSVLSLFNELQPMSEVGPVSLDEICGVLSERLRFLRREPPPRRYGRVFIGTIEEARGRIFDVVFVPGLAEGVFPRRALEDPLLLDSARRELDCGLEVQDGRVARERLLLGIAAAAARSRLVVSYSRMDAEQARPRVPSFYAMEVVRAAEGRLPDLRVFADRAAAAAPVRLGWPAPRDWRQAIDDAEYDLAQLDSRRTKGSGRYLVDVNAHLARSLRTRWRRWHGSWSGADGIVDPDPATLDALAAHRLSARAHSPSSLQHYAACPYRFALHAVHRFRPREEPVALEQMDPLTRGSLFHAVQFELFRELERAGWENVLDLADQVLDRVAARYEEELAPAIPRVWKTEVEDLRTDLRGWIHDLLHDRAEWEPIHYEFSFGLPLGADHDPDSSSAEIVLAGGVRLHGSIDMVEKHRARGVLRITDHKTGKAPEQIPAYLGGGVLLQPVLYGLAAEKLLGKPVASGRLFYCTQRGNYTQMDIPMSDTARQRMRVALETIDQAIAEGFLPPAPQPGACALCDYRLVCGPYEETRVRRKQPERLEALLNLRNTP